MSFSTDTKSEILKLPISKKCCKRAYASAFLLDSESDLGERIIYTNKSEAVCLAAQKTICGIFGKDSAFSAPVSNAPSYDLAVKSKEAVSLFSDLHTNGIEAAAISCYECSVAFLRGIFVSHATIADPENQYHLEFLFKHAESASAVYKFLADTFSAPKITNRASGIGLVYKNSSAIEDILSVIGANQAYFVLINGKIEREIRNNENRATNCETRNIAVSVDAAQKQLAAIEKLKNEDKFDSLPQSLKETAEMRILYPSLPLSELAGKFAPPLTKSGLNNRLKKIMELAN